MAEIVNSYKIGVVSRDFSPESLAFELNKLSSSDVEQFKLNASLPARERSAEANKIKLLELVRKIVSA